MDISLTDEERNVMQLLIEGYDARDIIDWLCIDYEQYKKFKNCIFKKLKINRITQILPTALKNGLLK
ncbi:hypothetical protein J6E39_01070 [bacterium]|nr:hypothetical protein [bacterium]